MDRRKVGDEMSVVFCFSCDQQVDTDYVTLDVHFAEVHPCECAGACCDLEPCERCYDEWVEEVFS